MSMMASVSPWKRPCGHSGNNVCLMSVVKMIVQRLIEFFRIERKAPVCESKVASLLELSQVSIMIVAMVL